MSGTGCSGRLIPLSSSSGKPGGGSIAIGDLFGKMPGSCIADHCETAFRDTPSHCPCSKMPLGALGGALQEDPFCAPVGGSNISSCTLELDTKFANTPNCASMGVALELTGRWTPGGGAEGIGVDGISGCIESPKPCWAAGAIGRGLNGSCDMPEGKIFDEASGEGNLAPSAFGRVCCGGGGAGK